VLASNSTDHEVIGSIRHAAAPIVAVTGQSAIAGDEADAGGRALRSAWADEVWR
jgi:hypothetical protein